MNIFILDGTRMTSKKATHKYIASILRLPDHYGGNLDALADCLGEYNELTTIILLNSDKIRDNLEDYGVSLIETFQDLSQGEHRYSLIIK